MGSEVKHKNWIEQPVYALYGIHENMVTLSFILYIYMTAALLTSAEPEKLMVQHQGPQFLPCFLPNHHRTWHKIQSYL